MKVIQIGPPLARLGGPAGYLDQLESAKTEPSEHEILFPPRAIPQPKPKLKLTEKLRKQAGQIKRSLFGKPSFYRPSIAELNETNGIIHRVMSDAARQLVESASATFDLVVTSGDAQILFAHDPFCAEHALSNLQPSQQVWLFIHNPFPIALYMAWCWGVPEWNWQDVAQLPDVRRWTVNELEIWRSVDRLIFPCKEAFGEFPRVDPSFGECLGNVTYLMTGGAGTKSQKTGLNQSALRAEWKLPAEVPLGLYLGNDQPYRGLDTLFAALPLLPDQNQLPGQIVLAGPNPEKLPRHPRVRALGRVADVSSLLQAVDFVINVNRFSLFDLSTIEALEAAKPLLLHATGGNKTFRDLGAGCVMIPDLSPEAIAAGLETMFRATPNELATMTESSERCYADHLTPAHLWRRHQQLYSEASSKWNKLPANGYNTS